jgi:DNA-directed RNA polymerase subunit RPC12/RpoP
MRTKNRRLIHRPARLACPACDKKVLSRIDPDDVGLDTVYAILYLCRSCGNTVGIRRDGA